MVEMTKIPAEELGEEEQEELRKHTRELASKKRRQGRNALKAAYQEAALAHQKQDSDDDDYWPW